MAQKSEERKNLNSAVKESFSKLPDPLHFELPHSHKKILELLYAIAILGAIISIVLFNVMGVLSISEANASAIILIILIAMLVFMFVENSLIHHKPAKSSS